MKKRTLLMLVLSIVAIIGASSLVYNALSANYQSPLAGTSSSGETFTTEITSSDTITTAPITDTTTTAIVPNTTSPNAAPKQIVPPTTTKKPAAIQPPVTQAPSTQTPASTRIKGNAPDFTVYNDNGDAVKLSDYYGKAVVLNFWASWCPPCKAEMPDFNKMYGKYSSQNVVFLMVNMTDGKRETKDSAKAYVRSSGYSFSPMFDTSQSAASAYGISTIPSTFFITKTGNISNKYIGQISEAIIESEIIKIK